MLNEKEQSHHLINSPDNEAVVRLKQLTNTGQHWYLAVLEAAGLWTMVEEIHNGRCYHYLIMGEAFDLLLLIGRLCELIESEIPDSEKVALLFHSRPPLEVPRVRFVELIGKSKYHQYLNYFYGIVVEQSLAQVIQEELRKERTPLGHNHEPYISDEAYRRIYGYPQMELFQYFLTEMDFPRHHSITIQGLKEYTYWLFKFRVKNCEPARVASDTKKALNWLKKNGYTNRLIRLSDSVTNHLPL